MYMCIFFVFIIGRIINFKFAESEKKNQKMSKLMIWARMIFEINIPLISLDSLKNKRVYDN